jgi:hypothetical protein
VVRALAFLLVLAGCVEDPLFVATGPELACAVPAEPAALFAFLRAGGHRAFTREGAVHASATGIHARRVRVYASPEVGASAQPTCAALVKEFYDDADVLTGYAVALKIQADSAAGKGWYWFETFDPGAGHPATSGVGASNCVRCHQDGDDYVITPLPLR